MARTLIGNIKGKDGRGITSIKKTGTTGPVDTYTITYTDSNTSTFTIKNSDSISLQRQIVPSAAVESSTTASQAYAAGDYVVVNGLLRKVKSAIAKGNAIGDSNSTATTVSGELATLGNSARVENLETHIHSNFSVVHVIAKRFGKMRFVSFDVNVTGSADEGWQTVLTVDASDSPSDEICFVGMHWNDMYTVCEGYVSKDGRFQLYTSLSGKGYVRGQAVWFVD